jgi:hypothetical protein
LLWPSLRLQIGYGILGNLPFRDKNFTAHPLFNLHGRIPYELVTHQMPDISEYTDFAWHDTIITYAVWNLDRITRVYSSHNTGTLWSKV